MKSIKSILLILIVFITTQAYAQFKVVAYLPKYQSSYANHLNDFDFTKVTHINAAFFNPDVNGNFHSSQGTGLDQIVTKAHDNNVKVLLSLAGGGASSGNNHFGTLLQDQNRAAFVSKVVALCNTYNADGIDVDLEGSSIDENYVPFITDLAAQLKPAGKLLTAAVAWYRRDNFTGALPYFDFINVMAYDRAGFAHSPLDYATSHLKYWKEMGVPAAKIIMGVPFYGWYDPIVPLNPPRRVEVNFKSLVQQHPAAADKDFHTIEPGVVLSYNGITTIKNKTALSVAEAGGIMFWQVLQDAPGNLSLLKAITDKIKIDTGWNEPFTTLKYDIGTESGNIGSIFTGSTVDRESISRRASQGFLPFPQSGAAKVIIPANSGGVFELQGTGDATKLRITAASTGAPSKFAWYNIGLVDSTPGYLTPVNDSKSIAKLSFQLDLSGVNANGQIIIPFGFSEYTASTFNNTSQLSTSSTAGVFGAIRLDFYGGNFATLSYRSTPNGSAPYAYTVINNNLFNKVGNYAIDVYCNNDTINRKYKRGNTEYTLSSRTFNIWVNGNLIQGALSLTNFPATEELALSSRINSFSINTSGNTSPTVNSLIATVSNVSVDYAFSGRTLLPTNVNNSNTSEKVINNSSIKVHISSNNIAEIQIASKVKEKVSVILSDLQGKELVKSTLNLVIGNNTTNFNLNNNLSGVYVVTINRKGKADSVKFVK